MEDICWINTSGIFLSTRNTENEHLKRTMFSLSTLCRQCDDCKTYTFIVYRKCIWAFNNNIGNPFIVILNRKDEIELTQFCSFLGVQPQSGYNKENKKY
jgi:hypothetical protein